MSQLKKILVFTATYNEIKNIEELVIKINKYNSNVDILIVDDNSPDGTSNEILILKKKIKNLFLITRDKKLGLDSAHKLGYKFAIENQYDYFITMDADLSHDPKEINPMLNLLESNDLVIGSRYEGGLRVINWPIRRLYISYFANIYARIITGVPVKDLTAGFKGWTKDTLDRINFQECSSQGYCFQIETSFRAFQKGCKLIEHPIVFTDRTVGESKMSKTVMIEAVFKVWLFGLWRLLRLKR